MADIVSTTISACSGKWYPRDAGPKASERHLYVPFKFTDTYGCGVIWILKSALVGSGGTAYTVTDASSTIVIAE